MARAKKPQFFFVLRDKEAIPVPSFTQWAAQFEQNQRQIELTSVGSAEVSTVFLGINISMSSPPLIFETMTLHEDGRADIVMRYSTYEQAEAGHKEVVAAVLEELKLKGEEK